MERILTERPQLLGKRPAIDFEQGYAGLRRVEERV